MTPTTNAINTARSLLAAALVATLTLGVSATPALADYDPYSSDAYDIDEFDLTCDEATAIACASFGVDTGRLIGATYFLCEHMGHDCYEVKFMTPGGCDPMGGYASYYLTHYTAYVDRVTGAVIDSCVF